MHISKISHTQSSPIMFDVACSAKGTGRHSAAACRNRHQSHRDRGGSKGRYNNGLDRDSRRRGNNSYKPYGRGSGSVIPCLRQSDSLSLSYRACTNCCLCPYCSCRAIVITATTATSAAMRLVSATNAATLRRPLPLAV